MRSYTHAGPEVGALRRWVYVSLAMLSAAVTTWALHATQESWRPRMVVEQPSQIGVEAPNPEIEALEAELARIQRRLDELRSRARF
jgi:hypothetical protein